MQHLQTINFIVLSSALFCLVQAVAAESAKTPTKMAPFYNKGAVKQAGTKSILIPASHKKANSEEKSSKQDKKKAAQLRVIPKAVPRVIPKVIPQSAKKSSQLLGVATKMSKPAVGSEVKAGLSLLKLAVPPNRKSPPSTTKGIPGIIENSQRGVSKRAVMPVDAAKNTNPATAGRGGFQGLARSRERTQLKSGIILPAVQKAQLQVAPAIGNMEAIRDANQGRSLGDAKEAAEVMLNMAGVPERAEGINTNLGLGSKGMIGLDGQPMDMSKVPGGGTGSRYDGTAGGVLPVVPGQGGRKGGTPWIPDDPKGGMKGAAGFDGAAVLGPTRIQKDPDGSITETTWFADGSESTSTRQPNGATSTISVSAPDENGIRSITRLAFDKNGNEIEDTPGDVDPVGNPNPDNPDPDGKWARWQAAIGLSGNRPDSTRKNPNRVNPGPEGAIPDNSAPQLVLTEEQLVADPSLSAARQQRGGLDPATSRRMIGDVTPGPGERPPGE